MKDKPKPKNIFNAALAYLIDNYATNYARYRDTHSSVLLWCMLKTSKCNYYIGRDLGHKFIVWRSGFGMRLVWENGFANTHGDSKTNTHGLDKSPDAGHRRQRGGNSPGLKSVGDAPSVVSKKNKQ